LHVTVLKEVPEDPQLSASWNDLVMRMERPEVFYTHQWALAASRAFRETALPLICLVHESDRLCGVAALATLHESRENAFFLTASTADYCDVVGDPALRSGVLAAIFQELSRQGVRSFVLANVPASSQTLLQLAKIAQSNQLYYHERAAYECGLIALGDAAERQALLQSIKRKDREKRGLKRMSQMGVVRLSQVAGEQLHENLAAIFTAQVSRFLATGRVSPLVRPERRQFLEELSRLLGQAGWLRVSRLEIGNLPVAWNFGFRFCDSWFWYLPTFEIQYEDLSPGSCLLRLLVEEAAADASVGRLDLGLGDEAYKERFANAECPTRHVQLSASLAQHGRVAARHHLVESAGRLRVEAPLRKARELAHGLQTRVRDDGMTATAAHGFRRARKHLFSDDEVLVFEAPPIELPPGHTLTLTAMDWKQLANAAIANADDVATMNYLVRCAGRLKKGTASGFVLQTNDCQAAHFLWVDRYDGFHLAEIDYTLASADQNAVIIFDCWTPASHRGHGYYAHAIRMAAARLQQQEKRVWIFSAAANDSSLRGIRKAAFAYRFSLERKTRLGASKVTRLEASGVTIAAE
jgi:CelD/BcsL family acetyltransferase involved in cellulose biosynthesis